MTCLICNSPISNNFHYYNDDAWNKSDIFSGLTINHCDQCGLGFVYPIINSGKINTYYSLIYRAKNSPFYFDFKKNNETRLPKSYPYANERSFSQILLARTFTNFDENDIFLDIGPGKGGAFAISKLILPSPKLYGIELTNGAAKYFKEKFNALTFSSLKEFNNSSNKAKIILMSHSLEHYQFSDLDDLFSDIIFALDDNGVIVIEVPHCDIRLHADIRGNDTPHTLFFSKNSLKLLLIKFGFEVLFIDTCCDLWKTTEQFEDIKETFLFSLKIKYKDSYNKLPIYVQNTIRSIVRSVYNVKKILKKEKGFYKTIPQHSYGGNRNCLRVIARKNKIN